MTVKEVADACSSYKTAVRRTIDRLGLADRLTRDESGAIQIPDDVAEIVMQQLRTTQDAPEATEEQQNATPDPVTLSLIEALKGQLEAQNALIQQQQETIATLTQALSNAQLLTAGTLQALNQITAPAPTQTQTAEEVTEEQEQDATDPTEDTADTPTQPDAAEPTQEQNSSDSAGGVTRTPIKAETPQNAPQTPQTAPPTTTPPTEEKPVEKPKRRLWGIFRR